MFARGVDCAILRNHWIDVFSRKPEIQEFVQKMPPNVRPKRFDGDVPASTGCQYFKDRPTYIALRVEQCSVDVE